jgi:hypothetical protein
MKLAKPTFLLTMILIGAVASETALARSGHGSGGRSGGAHFSARSHGGAHFKGRHFVSRARVGIVIAAPAYWYFGPPNYYAPPYYYPPVVAPLPSAPVYVEQGAGAAVAVPQQPAYWYYCAESGTYYPYVQECRSGWQLVAPSPPPGP